MPDRVDRTFLGWSAPALPAAAAWILDRAGAIGDANDIDLDELHIVVPGRRARRLLIGHLVELAESRRVALTPPVVVTPGELPGALLGPPGKPAPSITRRIAWIDALRQLDDAALAALTRHPLDGDDLPGWSRLAGALERASDELAGEGMRFADVPERASKYLPPDESDRWRALARVQDRAEDLLQRRGLIDDALATSARVLSNESPPMFPPRDIVLLAVPELNRVERAAIERGARAVDALIFAPESLADRFDSLGCVNAEAWSRAPVELDESRIHFAADPGEQAELALATLAQQGEAVDTGEVVICAADPTSLPRLRRRAALTSDVTLHWAQGDTVSRTPRGRLLSLLADHLRDPSFDTLGALARHPDVESALLARSAPDKPSDVEWWLGRLDAIRREHALMDPASPPMRLDEPDARALRFITDSFDALLGDLARSPLRSRPLAEWASSLESALRAIYAKRTLRPDIELERRAIEELEAVRAALDDLADAASGPDGEQSCAAWQAIGLVEERLNTTFIPEPQRREAIETLGWLDLPLDPSPTCVVVGMAESCVPGSVTHDAFLPDSLRAALGMRTNRARLARDAYQLSAINASRCAVFIASRAGDEGDPRTPSRLLFRCAGRELAQRVRRFTRPELDAQPRIRLASRIAPGREDRFAPALRIGPGYEPPQSMRVTDFGAYLRSPAGWYLERHLNLIEHEAPREMTPLHFGTLAHAALEAFGRDNTARDLDDAAAIGGALSDMLDASAARMFGANPSAAVRVQTELLRQRLKHFAHAQAVRRQDGWRIVHVEWRPPDESAALDVDGAPMQLRGVIDRIDEHPESGRWALIDYKTGAGAANVKTDHQRAGRWRSLQLPLYRLLVQPLALSGEIELAYAGLPESDKKLNNAWSIAGWTNEELEDADETARGVVRRIRAYRPGDALDAGDHPPDRGALGFITGARFDLGGRAGEDDASETEEAS